MGFGLPAAIGAQVAQPDAMVIYIDGDVSFCMSLHAMFVAAELGIKIEILALKYDKRYSHTHQRNPDFVKVVDGMGIEAQRLDAVSDITDQLEWFIRSEGLSLVEVKVDENVPVLPWVTPCKALDEMIMSPSQIGTSKK
ncbi:Thiamine pyrophosphate enzyme C-terminal TPP-binding [Penicillium samsonianum]|uniref:Thiamine pyrophosphate enzyme C-terminal TPP-binding n=1 Tax=Penicillium samsonianum TaxID=1882272 RepID=UPI00254664C9|nr:Thiamine pyrophosphate enzyme C-terminal TPP-binding [Penicillium samsonianum]KAJ6118258.1 Thiamine pyrophosphate enzyme C-terminal TPP-binding [Penicillium samsonianum]